MSAITDSDSAISGGSVRDVLADTNNLSERWKRLPARPRGGLEPTTVGLGIYRRRGLGLRTAQRARWLLYSFRDGHLLSHRTVSRSVTPNPRGPSHTSFATNMTRNDISPQLCRRTARVRRHVVRNPGRVALSARAAPATTRSTSGWTTRSWRMAASAPVASPVARASTIRAWWPRDASPGRSQAVIGPPRPAGRRKRCRRGVQACDCRRPG